MKKILFFLTVCFFAACTSPNKIPEDVIGIDSMKLIVWDLTKAGKLAQIEFEKNNQPIYRKGNPISKNRIPFKQNKQLIDSNNRKDSVRITDTSGRKKDTTSLKLFATQAFQQVFNLHHITKEEFYKSYRYYEEHPDKNNILMDSLSAYAGRQRQELYKKLE